jgi:hypothetical protein
LKKNPNVPLYRVVYACIFSNILILWRWSQDEYALICVMFDHGMLKLISCLIFSKLYYLIGTCLNYCGWVGFTICILNYICQSTIFKTIIFRLFCHIFYIVEHLVATLIQAWKNMYPHYQTYGGLLPHGYDHLLFNITSLHLNLNIFLCDQLNSLAEKWMCHLCN